MGDEDQTRSTRNVALRPYSAECAAAGDQHLKRTKSFKPAPPNLKRNVEKVTLASTSTAESSGSLLYAAARQQAQDSAAASGRFIPERFAGMALHKFGLSGSGGAKVIAGGSSLAGGAVPRKAKERKDGRSADIMDLAFSGDIRIVNGEVRANYAPISLPYFNVAEDDDQDAGGSASSDVRREDPSKKGRPTLVLIDEANSNAAGKLLGPQGELLEDKYFLLQLPCVLPELADPDEEVQREEEDAASAGAGATITRLPDGKLGKLRIYKSGKVKMEMGGVSFCVDQGCDTFFRQDLALVCPLSSEFISLGQISNRMVLTPDLESMLSELAQEQQDGCSSSSSAKVIQTG